jgi:hypothetical protein
MQTKKFYNIDPLIRFSPASTTAMDKKADGVANSDTDTTEATESVWKGTETKMN